MKISEAKQVDLVDYLSKLGFEPDPKRSNGNNYWYCSPLPDRNDDTPSFKVNRRRNEWYDFGIGKGGNIIDFGILFHGCTVAEFLKKLDGSIMPIQQPKKVTAAKGKDEEKDNVIKVLSTKILQSLPLLQYVKKRGIHLPIVHQYCCEVNYELNGKQYYAVGFKNNAGGYELRNEYFKGSSSPKDITFIDNGTKEVNVFEGPFEFLTYKTLYRNQQEPLRNHLILNSTSFFTKSLPLMQSHEKGYLFLNNDPTGEKFTQMALALDPKKFIDERKFFKHYEDLNDYLVNFGRTQKHSHQHRL